MYVGREGVKMVTGERPRVTYIKFLEMLVALLPAQQYKADVGSWSRAVYHLKNKYADSYPELFDRFEFIERDPAPPHSDEVNYFLRIEQEGDVIHVYNPGYERLEIPPESKDLLKRRHKDLLSRYETAIRGFIREVEREQFLSLERRSEPSGRPAKDSDR